MVGRTFDRRCLPDLAAAYVAFALRHRAHFQVMFNAGIDKERFPEIAASAHAALGVAIDAASRPSEHELPHTTKENQEAALACWAIAHGVAALAIDGALATAAGANEPEAVARRIVAAHFGFVSQPQGKVSASRSLKESAQSVPVRAGRRDERERRRMHRRDALPQGPTFVAPAAPAARARTSRMGGLPKALRYSRVNWETSL